MDGDSKFDNLLTHLGTGRWNFLYFFASFYWGLLIPSQFISGVYLAPALNHTCRTPHNQSVISVSEDSCSYVRMSKAGEEVQEACTEWDFDTSVFSSTLTSEFALVCDRSYLRAAYQSAYMLGTFVSPMICGYIADRLGRKVVVVTTEVAILLVTVGKTLLTNFMAILTFRFLLGIAHLVTMIVLALEVCEPKYRAVVGILTGLPWALGTMAWGGMAFLIRDWRWLQLAVSLPVIVIFPALYFIDESPRWLIVRGHHDRALRVLKKAARWNHVTLPPEEELRALMRDIQEETTTTSTKNRRKSSRFFSVPALLSMKSILVVTLVMCVDHFAVSLVFDGLNMSGDNFSVDPFLYIVLGGLFEVPGYTLTAPIITRWGRRLPTAISYILCSAVLLILTFIPSGYPAVVMTLALLGKMWISGAFQILFVYANELFPTEVRLQGMGACGMSSQLGSTILPFLTTELAPLVPWAPSVIYAGLSMTAGVATLALRETKDVPLPDTLADLARAAGSSRKQPVASAPDTAQGEDTQNQPVDV